MASRVSLPHIQISLDPRARVADWRERATAARRPLTWRDRLLLVWRLIWLPYWFGSDIPAPALPARNRATPPSGLAGEQVIRMLNQIARRVWLQRVLTILARGCWLGLLVGCFWLLVELSGGPALNIDALIVIGIALAAPSLILAALSRPTRRQVARMLDRSFHLHERMTTAVGNLGNAVPLESEHPSVIYLQIADAANVATELRRHSTFKIRLPVRELVLAMAAALVLASLYFLRGVGGGIPDSTTVAIPRFATAAERFAQESTAAEAAQTAQDAPTTAEVEERAKRSLDARRDLQTLAKALDDHAITRSAAEAIQRGDYEAAANDLRDLAARADELSPTAREALAQDLDEAASQMSPGNQELADASSQAASGLREGGEPAKEGVRELGDQVEQTSEQVVSQRDLADQMRQAQAAEASGQTSASQDSGAESDPSGQPSSQSEAGSEDPSAGSQPGQPSDGSEAQPGQASAGENPSGESSQPGGAGEQQPGSVAGEPGMSPEDIGAQPGGPDGAGDAAGQPGQADPNSADGNAAQGGGAGTSSSASDFNQDGSAASDATTASGAPPEAQVKEGEATTGDGASETGEARDAIRLVQVPGGESVRTSDDGGSSSVGSGTGVTVSGGTSVQGTVGDAGPDSNRVPADYRTIVEDYFSDPSGSS
jgi:hypothetical protein